MALDEASGAGFQQNPIGFTAVEYHGYLVFKLPVNFVPDVAVEAVRHSSDVDAADLAEALRTGGVCKRTRQ